MMKFLAPERTIAAEDLIELRKHWTIQRQAYPGWIVTPYENRETLWNYTRYWLIPIFTGQVLIPPPEDLALYFELNWRLERCMVPLFLDWVEKLSRVIETYDPIDASPSDSVRKLTPATAGSGEFSRTDLTQFWVELVFALCREAREDQDATRFEKWTKLLQKALPLRPEWEARWHHEQCLFALMRLDRARTLSSLERWPRASEQPFWEAKRAAILAELGNLTEAQQIAEKTLDNIRSRLHPLATNYAILSQEGWVLLLFDAIACGISFQKHETRRTRFRERWGELDKYGGNPWRELELLKLAVSGEPPRETAAITVRRDFDPDRQTVSRHFSSEPPAWKCVPAFALLRLYEEGAVPLRCGRLSIFSEEASRAADWIAPYAPLWSVSTKIRADKVEGLKAAFPRIRVAALTSEEVNNFYTLSKPPVEVALSHSWKDGHEASTDLSYRIINGSTEILSRLYFRLTQDQQEDVFSVACRMYKHPTFRHDFSLHDAVRVLFNRIIASFSEKALLSHFRDLLSLPIPTDSDFDVVELQTWPEPMAFVELGRSGHDVVEIDRSSWTNAIGNLLRITRSGASEGRGRAVTRLAVLNRVDAFSDSERAEFGQALWSRVDQKKGLPSETHLFDYSFLHLPEPKPGEAKRLLTCFLLNQKIPALTPEDGRQLSLPIGQKVDRYFTELLEATIPWDPSPKRESKFVDWSPEQTVTILNKISEWWSREKHLLQRNSIDVEIHQAIRECFRDAVEAFGKIIFPRLPADNYPEDAKRSVRVIDEMRKEGISVLDAEPASLFANPGALEQVVQRLRNALLSPDESMVRSAIFGIRFWALSTIRYRPLPMPILLIDALVARVLYRTPVALVTALAAVEDLVRHVPDIFTADHIEDLLRALEYLAPDTDVGVRPSFSDAEPSISVTRTIEPEDRPNCRRFAAMLAYQLSLLFAKQAKETPPVITLWRDIAVKDTLPEVRKAWQNQS
jgi:hypothetical protein